MIDLLKVAGRGISNILFTTKIEIGETSFLSSNRLANAFTQPFIDFWGGRHIEVIATEDLPRISYKDLPPNPEKWRMVLICKMIVAFFPVVLSRLISFRHSEIRAASMLSMIQPITSSIIPDFISDLDSEEEIIVEESDTGSFEPRQPIDLHAEQKELSNSNVKTDPLPQNNIPMQGRYSSFPFGDLYAELSEAKTPSAYFQKLTQLSKNERWKPFVRKLHRNWFEDDFKETNSDLIKQIDALGDEMKRAKKDIEGYEKYSQQNQELKQEFNQRYDQAIDQLCKDLNELGCNEEGAKFLKLHYQQCINFAWETHSKKMNTKNVNQYTPYLYMIQECVGDHKSENGFSLQRFLNPFYFNEERKSIELQAVMRVMLKIKTATTKEEIQTYIKNNLLYFQVTVIGLHLKFCRQGFEQLGDLDKSLINNYKTICVDKLTNLGLEQFVLSEEWTKTNCPDVFSKQKVTLTKKGTEMKISGLNAKQKKKVESMIEKIN